MIDYDTHPAYLEKLSTPELITLSQHFGLDIPAGMDRIFVIEELLEYAPCLYIYQEETRFTQDDFIEDEEVPDPVDLPKQYNFTYIEVLIRDPLWVYAFWEVRHAVKKQIEKSPLFDGYFLRVTLHDCKILDLFTIPVSPQDSSRYLNFPPDGLCRQACKLMDDCAFQVQLCARLGKEERILASSEPFVLPKILNIPGENDRDLRDNPLIRISGLDDLPVLRNGDRTSRTPLPRSSC